MSWRRLLQPLSRPRVSSSSILWELWCISRWARLINTIPIWLSTSRISRKFRKTHRMLLWLSRLKLKEGFVNTFNLSKWIFRLLNRSLASLFGWGPASVCHLSSHQTWFQTSMSRWSKVSLILSKSMHQCQRPLGLANARIKGLTPSKVYLSYLMSQTTGKSWIKIMKSLHKSSYLIKWFMTKKLWMTSMSWVTLKKFLWFRTSR